MKITPDPPSDAPQASARFADATYSEYSEDLHRYLARRIRHPEDAHDLAQEVFLRLMRVEAPERVRKPVAYLFSVASHLVREFRLRTGRENEHVVYNSEAADEAARTSGSSPDGLADDLNIERQLLRALQRLPRTHRAVLLLVKRDGLSHQEAATALGLSVHTIERYVVEATARMANMAWELDR